MAALYKTGIVTPKYTVSDYGQRLAIKGSSISGPEDDSELAPAKAQIQAQYNSLIESGVYSEPELRDLFYYQQLPNIADQLELKYSGLGEYYVLKGKPITFPSSVSPLNHQQTISQGGFDYHYAGLYSEIGWEGFDAIDDSYALGYMIILMSENVETGFSYAGVNSDGTGRNIALSGVSQISGERNTQILITNAELFYSWQGDTEDPQPPVYTLVKRDFEFNTAPQLHCVTGVNKQAVIDYLMPDWYNPPGPAPTGGKISFGWTPGEKFDPPQFNIQPPVMRAAIKFVNYTQQISRYLSKGAKR